MGANKIRVAALFAGGFGGVAPDFDHFLNKVTQGQVAWDFLHQPIVTFILIGGIVASGLGLYYTLVLRRVK